jgi:hypothetical protein
MAPTNRFFYRCTGCLEVVALSGQLRMEYSLTSARCGNCAQPFEYMGRVQRDRLVTDQTACKCDDRCVSARGPLCNCKCNGENHGAGMAGYITVAVDAGAIPIVHLPSPERAAKALAQFREYAELRDELRATLGQLLDRRRAGEFLPRPDFDRLRSLQYANAKTGKAKTHAARMKNLRAALAPATEMAGAQW